MICCATWSWGGHSNLLAHHRISRLTEADQAVIVPPLSLVRGAHVLIESRERLLTAYLHSRRTRPKRRDYFASSRRWVLRFARASAVSRAPGRSRADLPA